MAISSNLPARPTGRTSNNKTSKKTRQGKPYRGGSDRRADPGDGYYLYGVHAVAAALQNSRRKKRKLIASPNGLRRLQEMGVESPLVAESATPSELSKLVGREAVHQGIVLQVARLEPITPEMFFDADGAVMETYLPAAKANLAGDIADVADAPMSAPISTPLSPPLSPPLSAPSPSPETVARRQHIFLALDGITDPRNFGAIMRSACAFGITALVTTNRHAPLEGAVMAKSASGALDLLPVIRVVNLSRFLRNMPEHLYQKAALDSAGQESLDTVPWRSHAIIVLGAEGRGVRAGVRAACDYTARIDLPGPIRSLNVSNAAILALQLVSRAMKETEG